MTYRASIEASFMALLADTPYAKLTVARVCEQAGVSRKRFYAAFAGKEAVVESLFEQHAIAPMRSINQSIQPGKLVSIKESINELFYEGVYAHRDYYASLARTPFGVAPHFVEPVTRVLMRWNDYMLAATDDAPSNPRDEYTSYFFSSSAAMMLQRWINSGYAVAPSEMAAIHHEIISPYWESRVFGVS